MGVTCAVVIEEETVVTPKTTEKQIEIKARLETMSYHANQNPNSKVPSLNTKKKSKGNELVASSKTSTRSKSRNTSNN